MSLTIIINNQTVPESDIIKFPISKETVTLASKKLMPSTLDVFIDNTDMSKYDDRKIGSLFYGVAFYNQPLIIFDDDIGVSIFEGRIKNIKVVDKNRTLIISSANFVQDMAQTICEYSNSSDVTPAEIIYNILTDPDGLNIAESNINYFGFQNAINIQTSEDCYVNCNFSIEDNKNCLAVIQELCRITQCHIYAVNNRVQFYQWQPWGGELGWAVRDSFLLPLSYQHYYDDKNIYNAYSVAWDNSGTVNYIADDDAASISRFGRRSFLIPNSEVDDTASSAFKILIRNLNGASWAGNLALSRYSNLKKICTFETSEELSQAALGDQLDLNFIPFVREPVSVIEKSYDKEKKKIKFKAEFLNVPEEYYERDIESPLKVTVIDAVYSDYKIRLRWTKSTEEDHLGYLVFFTATKGEWETEYCKLGKSAIDLKNPSIDGSGYCYIDIYLLNSGVTYYFKVVSYDTSYNESYDSNIVFGATV